MQMTVSPSEQIWRNSALLDLLTNCLREPPLVICQVIDKLKLVLLFAVQYLTGRIKMTVIFVSYGLFCQLQIRHRDEEIVQ